MDNNKTRTRERNKAILSEMVSVRIRSAAQGRGKDDRRRRIKRNFFFRGYSTTTTTLLQRQVQLSLFSLSPFSFSFSGSLRFRGEVNFFPFLSLSHPSSSTGEMGKTARKVEKEKASSVVISQEGRTSFRRLDVCTHTHRRSPAVQASGLKWELIQLRLAIPLK